MPRSARIQAPRAQSPRRAQSPPRASSPSYSRTNNRNVDVNVNRSGGYYGPPRYGYGGAALGTTLGLTTGLVAGSAMSSGRNTTYVQQPTQSTTPQVYIVPTNTGQAPYYPGYPPPQGYYPQPYPQ